LVGVRADHDAVGIHEVLQRAALGEELRIRHVPDVREAAALERGAHLLARPDRDRRLHDEDHAAVEGRELVDRRPDGGEVGVAGVGRRRPDADEQRVAGGELRRVEGEGEPFAVPLEQLGQAGLVDGHAAVAKRLDPLRQDVADHDLVAQLRERAARDQTHPAGTEDPDLRHISAAAYLPYVRRPLAIASMVSFESESSSVFTTQYVAPFWRSTTTWRCEPE